MPSWTRRMLPTCTSEGTDVCMGMGDPRHCWGVEAASGCIRLLSDTAYPCACPECSSTDGSPPLFFAPNRSTADWTP